MINPQRILQRVDGEIFEVQKYSDACGRKPYPERKSCGFKNIRKSVDGSRIRKENVADSEISGYVRTAPEN